MRHQELDLEAQQVLRAIVKSVDKKLQYQVQDGRSPQDPMVVLALNQGTLTASMEVAVEEIRNAVENARDRAMLRERVKRAHERLWFPRQPERFFSTKAIRPGSEAFAHFRPSGGRR